MDVLIHCAAECNAERKVLVLEEGGVDREAMCNVLGPAVLTKLWRDEMSVNDNREDGVGGAMKKTVVFCRVVYASSETWGMHASERERVDKSSRSVRERKERERF